MVSTFPNQSRPESIDPSNGHVGKGSNKIAKRLSCANGLMLITVAIQSASGQPPCRNDISPGSLRRSRSLSLIKMCFAASCDSDPTYFMQIRPIDGLRNPFYAYHYLLGSLCSSAGHFSVNNTI